MLVITKVPNATRNAEGRMIMFDFPHYRAIMARTIPSDQGVRAFRLSAIDEMR